MTYHWIARPLFKLDALRPGVPHEDEYVISARAVAVSTLYGGTHVVIEAAVKEILLPSLSLSSLPWVWTKLRPGDMLILSRLAVSDSNDVHPYYEFHGATLDRDGTLHCLYSAVSPASLLTRGAKIYQMRDDLADRRTRFALPPVEDIWLKESPFAVERHVI